MAHVIFRDSKPQSMSVTMEVDEVGVAHVTEVLLCKDEGMAKEALDFAASDIPLPLDRPFVGSSSSERVEGGMWQVTRVFTAILDESDIGTYKLYKTSCVANREPIETHPNFSVFAGTPDTREQYGTVWDAQGNFERFTPYIGKGTTFVAGFVLGPRLVKSRKAGVKDYLMPIIKYEENMLVLAENLPALVKKLSQRDDPPKSPIKPSYAARTWLLTSARPEWVAEGTFRLKREWSMSGPNGWDLDVYPPMT